MFRDVPECFGINQNHIKSSLDSITRGVATQYPEPEAHEQYVRALRVELEVPVFEERGKPEYPGENRCSMFLIYLRPRNLTDLSIFTTLFEGKCQSKKNDLYFKSEYFRSKPAKNISYLHGNQTVKMEDSYLGMLYDDLFSE